MLQFFFDFYENFYDYLISDDWARVILILKIISWVTSIFFMFLIVVLLKRSDTTWSLRERKYARQIAKGAQHWEKKWQKITDRLDRGDEASLKLAVIEAGGIFFQVLQFVAPGESTEERLEKADKQRLVSYERIFEAQRLRDFIIHNPKTGLTHQQAQEAIGSFEQGLKELEYL
ncbi:MAG: hypothetical protein UV36_C0035G0008 [Parcubacteria group bacterium GW2011_GWC2_42_6]|nr:MAG: hypothetical protein UV36_C0035G0008 [Parcubacteria group bacterium GW2011_GWC2_42_6]